MPDRVKNRVKEKMSAELRKHIAACLQILGYDLHDNNLKDTPARVARIWMEELLTNEKPTKKLYSVFEEPHNQMVVMVGHKAFSRCPHHLERVLFEVSIAYLPDGRVIGLSKLGRIAEWYAKGLVLQERYVEDIAEGLMGALKPKGVAVHVRGDHMCMKGRGLKSSGSVITTALRGMFMDKPETRDEFLKYVLHHNVRNGL